MKIPVIKELVENHNLQELVKAEKALLDGESPEIQVGGDDEGEQLTHVLAAIWVRNEMDDNGTDVRTAIRNYSVRVRTSIN